MGSFFSSSGEKGCFDVNDRGAYILLRHYIVILKMMEHISKILSNDNIFKSLKTDYISFLVDANTMLDFSKELTYAIGENNVSKIETIITGVENGNPIKKEVTFYDTYNDFFLREQFSMKNEDIIDSLNSLKQVLNGKAAAILGFMKNVCVTEIGDPVK